MQHRHNVLNKAVQAWLFCATVRMRTAYNLSVVLATRVVTSLRSSLKGVGVALIPLQCMQLFKVPWCVLLQFRSLEIMDTASSPDSTAKAALCFYTCAPTGCSCVQAFWMRQQSSMSSAWRGADQFNSVSLLFSTGLQVPWRYQQRKQRCVTCVGSFSWRSAHLSPFLISQGLRTFPLLISQAV